MLVVFIEDAEMSWETIWHLGVKFGLKLFYIDLVEIANVEIFLLVLIWNLNVGETICEDGESRCVKELENFVVFLKIIYIDRVLAILEKVEFKVLDFCSGFIDGFWQHLVKSLFRQAF